MPGNKYMAREDEDSDDTDSGEDDAYK